MSRASDQQLTPPPPESWQPARQLALRLVQPIERFIHVEASSGLVLLASALVALVWANSPWSASYDALWHTPFTIGLGNAVFARDLHFWINDFLMVIFFLVVGLEIKREIVEGALSDMRGAALPIAAAVGGMLVPAVIFLAFNAGGPGQQGWGIPMATDIAFAVGVFALLGKRVPAALRVLLLAVAIIDDIGAIMVIAIFYSSGLDTGALLYVFLGIGGIFLLHRVGIRPGMIFVIPGLVLWAGMYRFGVHPTIAGVIVGLLAPVTPWYGAHGFLRVAQEALDDFRRAIGRPDASDHDVVAPLDRLSLARREALSPAKRIENALHPWVAFGIMPIFALANAGVDLRGLDLAAGGAGTVLVGVGVGLLVGKPLGIMAVSWLSVRLRLCVLPQGITWAHILIVGLAAGIGFTMAIFIAELAFADQDGLRNVAKLAVLIGTGAAGTLAYAAGRLFLPAQQPRAVAALTASDVEATPEYWTTGGGF